jgi:hypothetical protein
VNTERLGWYFHRFRGMSVAEVGWRCSDQARKVAWRRLQVSDAKSPSAARLGIEPGSSGAGADGAAFESTLPPGALERVPPEVRDRVIAAADGLLGGRWEILGVERKDMEDPDWFFDPVTGRRAPQHDYSFGIDTRSESVSGNVKQIWELSRLHHLTLLAGAFALSGEPRYAERVGEQLRSWWTKNRFLSGVHWTSGIELGIRLIAFVWIRRLLNGWDGVTSLFEENPDAHVQIWWHQRFLAGFQSRGSSANNHVIAEATGQLIASLAFPWFSESESWGERATALLEEELSRNTFPSGLNREMASDYHALVAELGLLAVAEADRAGRPLSDATLHILCGMLDAAAAIVDVRLGAPRQGDSDDGRALLLDDPDGNRWESVLALGGAIFGAPQWWPPARVDTESILVSSIALGHQGVERLSRRRSHFGDAGLTIMRTALSDGRELWCRCDAGPHGYLSIAAHAHADALSVEVRVDGVEVLADPGTFCYQGNEEWRSFFRSTVGHNTVEVGGVDQSVSGGPTLWRRQASTRLVEVAFGDDGEVVRWVGEHDGYTRLRPPAVHRRQVEVAGDDGVLRIVDTVETDGSYPVRLAFHLGPDIEATLDGAVVRMGWSGCDGRRGTAELRLCGEIAWTCVRGATQPVMGWYSSGFGRKQPASSIVGQTTCHGGLELETSLHLD